MAPKKRSEIDVKDTWALEDLFETKADYDKALENLSALTGNLAAMEGTLGQSAQSLLDYLRLDEEIDLLLTATANYAYRKADEDTGSAYGKQLTGQLQTVCTELSRAYSFVAPEIIAIDEETLEGFYRTLPDLARYRRALTLTRLNKPHTLSHLEEQIMAGTHDLSRAPSDIYTVFVNADMKFPSATDHSGETHALTLGSYIPLMQSDDRTLRKSAFDALYHTFSSFRGTLAACLNAQVIGSRFYARTRGYESTLHASLSGNEVPVEVYHNLIQTVHENMHHLHRYMEKRKKWMKLDEMHMYDIYAPVVPDASVTIPYEQAKQTVLDALAPLGADYCAGIKEAYDNRWIDVYENEGKHSGAYSAGARPHPYVLLNHTDDLSSQFTLAHEMGHAMHSYLSMKTQPTVYSDYVIFVAEVASTCNEALLMAHLLKKTTDRRQRAYLINYFLEQFRTTLYRQTMFAEFELEIHRMAQAGQTLTADALCALYHRLNAEYYGPDVVIDEEIDIEWARISHFFRNFYVFQYATGFSAAMALSAKILEEGEEAVTAYLNFLSSGSITDPISLLRGAGVDMASPDPIRKALEQFGSLIEELDALMD